MYFNLYRPSFLSFFTLLIKMDAFETLKIKFSKRTNNFLRNIYFPLADLISSFVLFLVRFQCFNCGDLGFIFWIGFGRCSRKKIRKFNAHM
jgi:hypothetical protein